jgi:replication-associated recombination protein RarA
MLLCVRIKVLRELFRMRSWIIWQIWQMGMVIALLVKLKLARNALNMFELAFSLAITAFQKGDRLTVATLRPLLLRTQIVYDRAGDKHYDTISAFIKSMRGSGIFSKDTRLI